MRLLLVAIWLKRLCLSCVVGSSYIYIYIYIMISDYYRETDNPRGFVVARKGVAKVKRGFMWGGDESESSWRAGTAALFIHH